MKLGVHIDHQKICTTDSGYNQILVIIDYFTKLAEAVPCQTASAEETCDHLITHWISRYGCPMTFQPSKAFVGDLTKELRRRSHIAHAHSTTYNPQTSGLVERQNRTLVNILRVYCWRYMTGCDKYLLQVVRAYNSTQHSSTRISAFMMLTGRERERERESNAPDALLTRIRRAENITSSICERSNQETTGVERTVQKEYSPSTDETTEEV